MWQCGLGVSPTLAIIFSISTRDPGKNPRQALVLTQHTWWNFKTVPSLLPSLLPCHDDDAQKKYVDFTCLVLFESGSMRNLLSSK